MHDSWPWKQKRRRSTFALTHGQDHAGRDLLRWVGLWGVIVVAGHTTSKVMSDLLASESDMQALSITLNRWHPLDGLLCEGGVVAGVLQAV